MIHDASRRRVQSARSTTIAGRATAVIISSRPARNTPRPDDEQHERVPARHGVHPRECIRDRRSLPAGAGAYQRIVTPPETLGTRDHASQ